VTPAVGDRVRVADRAPGRCRPGHAATVIDLRRLEDEGVGCRIASPHGSLVLRVRFDDGAEVELPAHLTARSTRCAPT
jgi:hypothetical protein